MVEEIIDESPNMSPAHTADLHSPDGPAAKRVALGHATALAGLTLQVVMQFAGKNDGIFVASVCRSWKNSYKSTFKDGIRTHYSAALMSLQRLKWIPKRHKTDLPYLGLRHFAWYLGKYAPRDVIEAAILDESLPVNSEALMQGIAGSGRLPLMKKLWDDHVKAHPTKGLGSTLAQLGHDASKYGHLRVLGLIWSRLGDVDIPHCGRLCVDAAVRAGHVHVLEFLSLTDWWGSDNGPTSLGGRAASNNRINVLRWLAAHDQDWDSDVALSAAARANIDTVAYLFENACPGFDKDFVSCCVRYERLDALQWCYDTLRPEIAGVWNEDNLQEWLLLAGHCDSILAAKFLIEHGALWPNIGQRFGEQIEYISHDTHFRFSTTSDECIWSTDFLEWAMAEGCTLETWTTTTCARLVKQGEYDYSFDCPLLEAMSWAHAHGCSCECLRDEPDF